MNKRTRLISFGLVALLLLGSGTRFHSGSQRCNGSVWCWNGSWKQVRRRIWRRFLIPDNFRKNNTRSG